MDRKTVDVAILTYKPGEKFLRLLYMLKNQSLQPEKIIIINTEEKDFDINSVSLENDPKIEIHHISREEFNHGGTRNLAASYSTADNLIFMTQDAVPCDNELIAGLLRPMGNEKVAVSYARQVPEENAGIIEKYNRSFNYPPLDRIKEKKDIRSLGIKTIFCSDVCACYRRKYFDELGGFVESTVFNEDMIFADKAVDKGYAVYYASKAKVTHSHEYTALQQFRRNFDLGASQEMFPEVFQKYKSEGEGKRLVRGCISYLLKKKKAYLIPGFIFHCAARYAGYLLGKRYKKLGKGVVLKLASDKGFWEKYYEKESYPGQ